MGYMTPDEQQGVLIAIGTQANAIHALQEMLEQAQAEVLRLKETYEPTVDSSEMVYSDTGASDQPGGTPQDGSADASGGSHIGSPGFSTPL